MKKFEISGNSAYAYKISIISRSNVDWISDTKLISMKITLVNDVTKNVSQHMELLCIKGMTRVRSSRVIGNVKICL